MSQCGCGTADLKVLIAGGGTGGHVYPGIAIAKEIRRRCPDSQVLFVGTESGLEARIIPKEGFALKTISISGLKGTRGLKKLRGVLEIPLSLWQSYKIIRSFKPRVVVGVGGYASGSPVFVALLGRIPILLQEQNALPGLTNRWLGRFADKVATAFKECENFFGKRAVLTGNPVREDFKKIHSKTPAAEFVVLVFGGSQGAHAINEAIVEALERLRSDFPHLFFVHQTGERDFEWVSQAYRRIGACCDVRPFFEDMPVQVAKADLIVCRSGATTLAEITVAGKAALLVPFPFATDNHQLKNAEAMSRAGAAEILLQKELDGKILADKIHYFYGNRPALRQMEERSRGLGRPDSSERIVDLVLELAHV